MTRIVILALFLTLAGCSGEKESTYSVDELTADEVLLGRILSECRNNPGDERDTANCVNAEAADGKLRLQKMRKALGN
jgi:hypothetical protein